MADISAIRVGSTTYSVKDATARTNISSVSGEVTAIKSGATVTTFKGVEDALALKTAMTAYDSLTVGTKIYVGKTAPSNTVAAAIGAGNLYVYIPS